MDPLLQFGFTVVVITIIVTLHHQTKRRTVEITILHIQSPLAIELATGQQELYRVEIKEPPHILRTSQDIAVELTRGPQRVEIQGATCPSLGWYPTIVRIIAT